MHFSQIPDHLLVPGQYQEIDNSLAGDQSQVKKVLIIGLKTATGTAQANQALAISSAERARLLLGEGSPASLMAIHFLALNGVEQLWALPISEPEAGVAAVKKLIMSVTNPQPGTLVRYIAGHPISVDITAVDTPNILAAKLQAAINACPDLPVEASMSDSTPSEVILTCLVKGETGNTMIDIGHSPYGVSDPRGVTVTVATVIAGSGNPNIEAALQGLGDTRYHYLITDLSDQATLVAVATELESRYQATRQIGGRAFVAVSGPVGDATTHPSMIQKALTVNSAHMVLVPRGQNPQVPAVWAARIAAQAIRSLADDPAGNTQGIRVPGLMVTDRWDAHTRQRLLEAGIATWKTDNITGVLIERLVTSYTETADGSRDTSYLDVQVVETVDAVRAYINVMAAKRFQKWKLASTTENFGSGSRVMSPAIWKGFLLELYQEVFIGQKQWCQDLSAYKESLIVAIKPGSKTCLEYQHRPILIGQFLIGAGRIQFT